MVRLTTLAAGLAGLNARVTRWAARTTAPDMAAMGTAALLFLISGFIFLILFFLAIGWMIELLSPSWATVLFAAWAWGALCLSGYNIVRSLETINAPGWRAVGWIVARLVLIIASRLILVNVLQVPQ